LRHRPEENYKNKHRNANNKNYRCNLPSVKQDKERFVNVKNNKEWNNNSEHRCWINLAVRIKFNKWHSKSVE
jgi:uncharacterized protein YifE (UPF0438 family)